MPTFETRVTVGIYCTCGTPLIGVSSGMNHVTVNPCPLCTQVKRIEEREKEINRRGVMVSERST